MNTRFFLLFSLFSLITACGMKSSLILPPEAPPPSLYDQTFGKKGSPERATDRAPVTDAPAPEKAAP